MQQKRSTDWEDIVTLGLGALGLGAGVTGAIYGTVKLSEMAERNARREHELNLARSAQDAKYRADMDQIVATRIEEMEVELDKIIQEGDSYGKAGFLKDYLTELYQQHREKRYNNAFYADFKETGRLYDRLIHETKVGKCMDLANEIRAMKTPKVVKEQQQYDQRDVILQKIMELQDHKRKNYLHEQQKQEIQEQIEELKTILQFL